MELQEKITKVSSEPLVGDSVLLPGVKISSEVSPAWWQMSDSRGLPFQRGYLRSSALP